MRCWKDLRRKNGKLLLYKGKCAIVWASNSQYCQNDAEFCVTEEWYYLK